MQEDISMKKFDLRAKQLHLAAVKAQVRIVVGNFFFFVRTNSAIKTFLFKKAFLELITT